jgi:shikimate dehydrogenase
MNAPSRPLLVATLPGRSVEETRRGADAAASAGADIGEVRFDRWLPSERARSRELFPTPVPLMATLRSAAEGGEGPDDAAARAAWRADVHTQPFAWVDIERDHDPPAPVPSPPSVRWVLSTHLPAAAPPGAVAERLSGPVPPGSLPKVVLPASMARALGEVLTVVRALPPRAAIVMTTGPSGPLLRAWARRLELPMVYASLPTTSPGGAPVEPSQIPVDRLRSFFEAPPGSPLFAVVGRPIAHSRSPALHHFWMEREGRRGLYIPLEFSSDEEFTDSLAALVEGGFRGLNVTHPFKEAAYRAATQVGASALACGCANTLTFDRGEIQAENTDLAAIRRRLKELRAEGRWDGERLLVVGAGGAARAALAAARELGISAAILARRPETAARLAREFDARAVTGPSGTPASVIVHATTVGRRGSGALDVPLPAWLGPRSILVDFVYRAEEPILPELAALHGAAYEDGGRLLAYAAAASYGIWWGAEPAEPLISAALGSVA